MLVEVRVQSLALDRNTNTPVVILQELDGDRVLPIWIGPAEASSIAMRLADMDSPRPLTHDLFCSLLGKLGGAVTKVVITEVQESTYYAELVVTRNGETITVDARPSDSIAVALRSGACVMADDSLLEIATIEIAEDESITDSSPMVEQIELGSQEKKIGPEELKEHLRPAARAFLGRVQRDARRRGGRDDVVLFWPGDQHRRAQRGGRSHIPRACVRRKRGRQRPLEPHRSLLPEDL